MEFYQNLLFSDIDELIECVDYWQPELRQLDTGVFSGIVHQYGFSTSQIGITGFSRKIDQRGTAPEGFFTFAILEQRDVPTIWRGVEVDHNMVLVYQSGDEIDCSSKPEFKVTTYSISDELFHQHCWNMGYEEVAKKVSVCKIFPISFTRKQQILKIIGEVNHCARLSCEVVEEESIRETMDIQIAYLIIKAIGNSNESVFKSPITEQSAKALKEIERHLGDSISPPTKVRDLCKITGLSERTLQYLFMWKYGVTPMAYIKRVRLNGVRQRLYHSSPKHIKISDIAGQFGFWHMGQFAKDYRQLFGELPSDTLKRT